MEYRDVRDREVLPGDTVIWCVRGSTHIDYKEGIVLSRGEKQHYFGRTEASLEVMPIKPIARPRTITMRNVIKVA